MADVLWFDELDSTNAEARRRAEGGETGDLWIAARRQTHGRGRRGRVWESPTGNLYATLLTTTDKPPAEAAQLSFVAALAVADLCDAYTTPGLARLKWPNDVMLGDAKVAGILIESGGRAGGLWLAIGIGVNLAAPPEAPERPATALAEYGDRPAPADALSHLRDAFVRWRGVWDREGFAPIRAAWTDRAYQLGQSCVARLGSEEVRGVADGLDATGALLLRLPQAGGVRAIAAGEVFFPSP